MTTRYSRRRPSDWIPGDLVFWSVKDPTMPDQYGTVVGKTENATLIQWHDHLDDTPGNPDLFYAYHSEGPTHYYVIKRA